MLLPAASEHFHATIRMGNHNGDSDDEEDDAKNIVMLYPNLQTIYKHKERRLSVAQRFAILLEREQVIL